MFPTNMRQAIQVLSLSACVSALVAPHELRRRGNDVIVWKTETATTTTDQTVATVYTTIAKPTTTAFNLPGPQSLQQVQVLINSIVVEYSYTSDRTVFVVPTTVQSSTTQTQNVAFQTSNGVVLTPAATTTLYNIASAAQVPVNTMGLTALTGTIPAASMIVNGLTVPVAGQTYTYYAPVVDAFGGLSTIPMTVYAVTVPASSWQAVATSLSTPPVDSQSPQPAPSSSAAVSTAALTTSTSSLAWLSATSSQSANPIPTSSSTTTSTTIAAATTVSSTPSSSIIAESTQASFQNEILQQINQYRRQHSASDLVWDNSIASTALSFAQQCQLDAASDSTLGENRAAGTTADVSFYLDTWYQEGSKYDYSHPGFAGNTGHFTQLVWANTSSVGCGFTSGCGQYPNYLVCRFAPAGNIMGGANNNQFFIDNVHSS